jgi:hypothetical protein
LHQNQRQALLERTAREIGASQLNQIPSSGITGGDPLEIRRRDSQRNLDESIEIDGADLTIGDRLATEAVPDSEHRRRKAGNYPRRDHDH